MSAHAPAAPVYADLYDACAYRNKLKVKLHICPEPEGMSARAETYYPTVPSEDWELGRSHEKLEPLTPVHVKREISFFVEVWDGKTLACSGDLGPALYGQIAVAQIRRMARVLVSQGRVGLRDFPHLRP